MPVSLAAILVILVLAAEPAIAGIACNDRGCRVVRSDCQILSGYVGETEFDAIAVKTCNPPPAGPSKTRNQSPLGSFCMYRPQARSGSVRATAAAVRPTGSSSRTRLRRQSGASAVAA